MDIKIKFNKLSFFIKNPKVRQAFSLNFFNSVINFLVSIIMFKLYGSVFSGAFYYTITIINLLVALVSLGFQHSIIRLGNKYLKECENKTVYELFILNLFFELMFAIAIIIFYFVFDLHIVKMGDNPALMYMILLMIPFSQTSVSGVLRLFDLFNVYVRFQNVTNLFHLLNIILCYYFSLGFNIFVTIYIITFLLSAIFLIYQTREIIAEKLSLNCSMKKDWTLITNSKLVNTIFRVNLKFYLPSVLNNLKVQTDTFIVGGFLGMGSVGVYNVFKQIFGIFTKIGSSIGLIYYPALYQKFLAGDKITFLIEIEKKRRLIMKLAFYLVLTLFISGSIFFKILNMHELYNETRVFLLIMIAGGLNLLSSYYSVIFMVISPNIYSWITAMAFGFFIFVILLFGSRLTLLYTAAIQVLFYTILCFSLILSLKKFNYDK